MSFTSALESVTQVNGDLFVVELPGEREILFRLPSHRQAMQYAMILELAGGNPVLERIIYDFIFSSYAEDKFIADLDENLPAGVPETIAKTILFLSGVGEGSKEYTQELFGIYREQANLTHQYMKRFICSAFSGYTFKDLEELNYQELVNIFIEAEKLLIDRGIIDKEHDFKAPEQEKPPVATVGEMISQDASEFNRFESVRQSIQNPADRAAKEEAKFRQAMAKQAAKR